MAHIWQAVRSGDWLTPARARGYSLILLAICALAIVGWIAVSDGLVDRNGKPIGTDFASFYAAGSLALEGKAGDAYDMAAHYARERQLFGPAIPYYGFLYPPLFLLAAAPLASLPYPLALAIWQGGTLALYLAVVGAILRRTRRRQGAVAELWLPVAAAFPAVFVNLGHGQNGFLTAALLGGAMVALPRRPIIAGVLIGLLAYKPQFAMVIPFALLAAGRWRTMLAAAVTVAALAAISLAAFGPDCWSSFFASTKTSRKLLLEQGSVGFEKLQSIFAAVRMWDGSVELSYAMQGAVSLAAVGSTAWIWRYGIDHRLKAAALVSATALASPHILDYDLMILGPAIAFFVAARSGRFRDYEISGLAVVWLAPLLARTAAGTIGIPIGFIAMLMLHGLILRATLRAHTRSGIAALRVAQA
jgi:hypothetical protein